VHLSLSALAEAAPSAAPTQLCLSGCGAVMRLFHFHCDGIEHFRGGPRTIVEIENFSKTHHQQSKKKTGTVRTQRYSKAPCCQPPACHAFLVIFSQCGCCSGYRIKPTSNQKACHRTGTERCVGITNSGHPGPALARMAYFKSRGPRGGSKATLLT